MLRVVISHKDVRVVKNLDGRYEVQEKDWKSDWVKVFGTGEYFNFDQDVIEEFARVLIRKL